MERQRSAARYCERLGRWIQTVAFSRANITRRQRAKALS
jgi:hypothetical protein